MNNKILKRWLIRSFFEVGILLGYQFVAAQNLPVSEYGLPYINTITFYQKSIIGHPNKVLKSLNEITGIQLDLRYATDNNLFHKKFYTGSAHTTFLRKPAFLALDSVTKELSKWGLYIVVFDAYRPYHVTIAIWNDVKDERYAANPAKGSGHNRGLAIDLTMADLKTHKLVNMPTGFDSFTDSAHQDFKLPNIKKPGSPAYNRDLLRKVMEKYGFQSLTTEWWHFSWPDTEEFEILDLDFSQLEQVQ